MGAVAAVAVFSAQLAIADDVPPEDAEDNEPSGHAIDVRASATDVEQIEPPSPVAGGNDPNRSDDALYILQSDQEDLADEAATVHGSIMRPVRPHVFVGPSGRAAAKMVLNPRVSVEAFVTSGLVDFKEQPKVFETRDSSISGGMTSTVNFGLFNGAFAYEHKTAYAQSFDIWKSTSDKIGATLNKTLPFFVTGLTVTPQLLLADELVTPVGGSVKTVEPTAGFTYTATKQLSFAFSAGYSYIDLYNLPGYRHDNGAKVTIGATYKFNDKLVFTVGASTNRTILYGFPQYRANGALSPSLSVRYNITPNASVSLAANYARFLSTVPGGSTFKYNLNPTVALTVPL